MASRASGRGETRGLVVAKLSLAGCRGRRGTAVAGGGGPREDWVRSGEAGAERTEWRGVKKGSRAGQLRGRGREEPSGRTAVPAGRRADLKDREPAGTRR